MKPQKWPSAHVLCFRIRLRSRGTIPFTFATYYDPKQHPPSTGGDAWSSRKIFQSPRSKVCNPPNPIFLHSIGVFSMILAWKHERNLKNGHQLTFGALESDWDVVRSYRLLLRLTMIQNNSPQALVVIREALENFFRALEATCVTLQTPFFAFNWSF